MEMLLHSINQNILLIKKKEQKYVNLEAYIFRKVVEKYSVYCFIGKQDMMVGVSFLQQGLLEKFMFISFIPRENQNISLQ
jgi:hypothetical protein